MRTICRIFLLVTFLTLGCDEKEQLFDLFPIKTGNEYFYKYYYYTNHGQYMDLHIKGTELWRVISELKTGDTLRYTIERILNGIAVGRGPYPVNDTIFIKNQIKYLVIDEIESELIFSDFTSLLQNIQIRFKRLQTIDQIELKRLPDGKVPSWTFRFRADSGLTAFYYNDPPNQITTEYLILDSLSFP